MHKQLLTIIVVFFTAQLSAAHCVSVLARSRSSGIERVASTVLNAQITHELVLDIQDFMYGADYWRRLMSHAQRITACKVEPSANVKAAEPCLRGIASQSTLCIFASSNADNQLTGLCSIIVPESYTLLDVIVIKVDDPMDL